jgi:hypothetical protein
MFLCNGASSFSGAVTAPASGHAPGEHVRHAQGFRHLAVLLLAGAHSWIAATCGTPRSGSIFVGGYRTGANIPDHHRFKEKIMS